MTYLLETNNQSCYKLFIAWPFLEYDSNMFTQVLIFHIKFNLNDVNRGKSFNKSLKMVMLFSILKDYVQKFVTRLLTY